VGSHSVRLDRRTFIAGLGAASLTPWPRAALAAPHVFDLADDIRLRIIDSAVDLTTRAEAIRLAGVKTVIRYYARGPGQWDGKVLSKPELDALEVQNLSVAVVFQHENNKAENFLDENKKLQDLMWARTHADHLQQPEGTPIYFGADFELRHWDSKTGKSDPGTTDQRIAAVRQYFEYMRDELAKDGRKLGVYGCGSTLELLSDVADYFWLSASADYWHSDRFFNSGKWHLYQNRVDLVRYYDNALPCPIDTNLANPQHAEFGQWRRSGPVDRDSQDVTRAVIEARSFVAVQQLALYRNHPRRDPALLKPEKLTASERPALRYAFNVKIVTEDAEFYGVSLDEGDTVRGWCHKSDLSADGMPLRARRALAAKSAALSPNALAARPAPAGYRVADAGSTPVALTETVPLPPSRPVPLPRSRPARLARAN
jgi:hypothetical protein